MIINDDLVWLQGPPAIAAVHYHKHLRSTHVLYCPDEPPFQPEKNVRELARAIVAVLDSNKKKLAIHFMYPCAEKKSSEIVRAIHRTRPHLSIDCCVLQTNALQNQLLLGWSMAAMAANSPNADLWVRRCLVPFSPAAFLTPGGCNSVRQMEDYKQPFCISDRSFIKRAFFVNVTLSLCATPPSSKAGIIFKEDAIAVIRGWSDATRQLSIAGTLVMLVDEKTIYGEVLKDSERPIQERLLADARKSTLASLAKLQAGCPVYLYARDYFSRVPESIYDQIACMQHRHHLRLSYAMCLHHSRKDAASSQSTPYFTSIQHVYINETMNQNRTAWKMQFTSAIHNSLSQVEPNQDGLISLAPQDLDLSIDNNTFLLPLVKDWNPTDVDQSRHEEYGNRYIHSVSISDLGMLDSWKKSVMKGCAAMEHPVGYRTPEKLDASVLKAINSPSKPEVEVFEGDPSELADSFAERLFPQKIKGYINNDKWYARGEEILHQLDDLEFNGNDKSLTISAKLKGTAKDPYSVTISFAAEGGDSDIEIVKGHCDCPVGKEGKCKHCASVLLRFMINTAEFEYSVDTTAAYDNVGCRQKQGTLGTKELVPEQTYPSESPILEEKQYLPMDDTSPVLVSTVSVPEEIGQMACPSNAVIPPKPRTKSRSLPWAVAAASDLPEKKDRRRKTPKDGDHASETIGIAENRSKRKPTKKRQVDDGFLSEDEPQPKRKKRLRKEAPLPSPLPQQPSPNPVSPQLIAIPDSPPDLTMASAPQEVEEDIDSDATEDGLGPVMEPTQRTTSWMSLDSPGLPTSTEVKETMSSLQEMSDDDDKTEKSSPEKNAMDDLFDEVGL